MSPSLLVLLRAESREIRRLATLPGCTPLPVSDFHRAADYYRQRAGYRLGLRGSYGLRLR